MLDGPVEQIIDSTPMLGAAATQDTVRLVRHGVRKLLDAVGGVDAAAAAELDRALAFDYQRPAEKPDCRWREKAERERMLTRVAQDAELALRAVERADGLLDQAPVAAAHRLLRDLLGQDFEIGDHGVPRLHRGTAAGRIISTVDETSKQFHVLVLKTNMAIPYTSVFIRLDCKYWSADAEARMRAKMNASEPAAK